MTKSTAINPNKTIALLQTLLEKSKKRQQDTVSACEDEKRRLRKQLGIKRAAFQKQISQRYIKLFEKHKRKCQQDQDKVIAALKKKIADQEIELKLYRDKAKGRSTKESLDSSSPNGGGLLDANANSARNSSETKKKGKRRNTQGYGRKQHTEPLPEQEIYHTLLDNDCNCPSCGAPRKSLNATEDSEEIDYQIKVVRIKHKRKVYKKTCECKNEPLFKTAPKPPRALPKGKYSDNLYLETVLSKYLYQIPTNVLISQLADQGLKGVNPSTLCNAIKRVDKFMQPLYEALIKRNKSASHWHDDESRLGVFIPRDDDKKSYNYAVFQHASLDSVVFELTPTREAKHLEEYYRGLSGIINSDRAAIYKKLAKEELAIIIAFCWVHVRRDFIKTGRYIKGNRGWALKYLAIIRSLFYLNKKRLSFVKDSVEFDAADTKLRHELQSLEDLFTQELADSKLKTERRKNLESLQRHWEGLNVFVENPTIPMDNNSVERRFRPLARFRNNCYGVFSEEFGQIAVRFMSIFATLQICGIDIRSYFKIYFEEVAKNNGQAPESEILEKLLPWDKNLKKSLEQRQSYVNDTS